MAAVLATIEGLFGPISALIEHFTGDATEKIKLQEAVVQAQIQAQIAVFDLQKQLLSAQTQIVVAEAQGGSWIQRNWRPITMLVFLLLVVCDSFGLLKFRLADQAWTLLQIGLGGYVIGRSVEKTAVPVVKAVVSNLASKTP